MKTVMVPVKGLNFAGCGREIEKRLGKLEPIRAVEASYVSQTVTITYDDTRMTEVQLRKLVEDCGFACGEPLFVGMGPSAIGEHGPHVPGAEHPGQVVPPRQMEAHPAMERGSDAAGHAMAAIRLSKATVRKMKQNLFWAAIYNVVAIPVAAGVLYPFGILLSPAIGALAMSASSITVATNAVLLKGAEKKLREEQS